MVSKPLRWVRDSSAYRGFLEEGSDGALGNVVFTQFGRLSLILLSAFLKVFPFSALPPGCRQGLHEEGSYDVAMSLSLRI